MAPEFRELLDRSVQDPPAEPHHVVDIVHRAQRARRRRRVVAVGVSATAVLAVSAVGVAVSGAGPGADDAQPAQNGIVGPVAHLGQATPGVVGKDFAVGATYTNKNLDRRNGRLYQLVTDRGEVLVSQPTLRVPGKVMTEYNRYALLDPTTGRSSWLPTPPDARYSTESAPSGPEVRSVNGDTVVWLTTDSHSRTSIDVYDRGTGRWKSPRLDVASLATKLRQPQPEGVTAANGRLYFKVSDMLATGDATDLWSAPVDGATKPRLEGRQVGDWAIDGSTLAYTEATNRPISKLTVRDLTTGKEASFDPQSGDHCNQLSLALSGDRIALGEYCGTTHKVRDDRVQVVTTSGQPVVTLQGDGLDPGGLGNDFVAAAAYGAGGPGKGTYVYDFGNRRLVRISDGVGSYSPTNGAGGAVLTWGTPVNHRHGMKLWAGTWR